MSIDDMDMIFNSYDGAEHKARKAYELYEEGQVSQALAELDDALAINPANGSWHFNKALALDSMNRFAEAISEYEQSLELNPSDVEILTSLAVDYTRSGQYDRAIETFEQAQLLDPMYEPCYCNRIITYTEMEKHDLAEQMFYMAQHIEPDCALCYYNIGNSLFIRGLYKKAISCWQKTAEIEKTHPQINYRIAQAYWADGDTEKAHKYFLAELREDPGNTDVIADFAMLLLETRQVESAKEKFNRILEFDPDSAIAHFYLGEIALNRGDTDDAEKLFKKAMQIDDTLFGPRFRIAQCAIGRGEFEAAKSYLASEMRLGPENSDVLVSMASMFLRMDMIDEAGQCLLRATDFNFINPAAHYYLGICCALRGKYADAAEFFLHTLEIDDKYTDAVRDLAAVYIQMGRVDEAAELIKQTELPDTDAQFTRQLTRQIRMVRFTRNLNRLFKPLERLHLWRN